MRTSKKKLLKSIPWTKEKSDSHDNEIFPMKSETCVPKENLHSTIN